MKVYIDSAPENMTPALALEAEGVMEDRWNGWVRPLATAAALSAFLEAWQANDPNGVWGSAAEVGATLLCTRSDEDEPADVFPFVGMNNDGEMVYDLTGWTWVLVG